MCGTAADDPTQHDGAGSRDQDAFGRPITQSGDGHGAWNCNNWLCEQHPDSIYGTMSAEGRQRIATRKAVGTWTEAPLALGPWSAAKADAAQAVEAAAIEAKVNPQPADSPSITHVRNALSELLQVSDWALHRETDGLRVSLAGLLRRIDAGTL